MPISLHSHSGQFCKHATDTLESVIQTAVERGFISYGLTEHMPRDRPQDLYPEESELDPSELAEQFDRFIAEACRLKLLYSPKISLLVGVETELIDQSNTFDLLDRTLSRHQDNLDYLVGSVHHVNQIPIDFDKPLFDQAVLSLESTGQPIYSLCERYFDAQYKLIDRYRPEVIGHFDLCLLFNPDLNLQAEPTVWAKIERNIKLAISYGALIEVNSASIRKGWSTPYPSQPILKLIISLGGRLTLSDDSHGLDRVGLNYNKSFEYLKSNHVSTLWYLVPAGEDKSSILQPRGKVSAVPLPGNWWEHPFWSHGTSNNPPTAPSSSDYCPDLKGNLTSSPSISIELASLNSQQNQDTKQNETDDKFKWNNFPTDRFTNQTWFVISSSLPFWKNKKNVTISYSNLDNEPSNVLYDLVEYHSNLTDPPNSKRKRLEGIDRPKLELHGADQSVEWRWRGKGIMKLLSSDWKVIGYSLSSLRNDDGGRHASGPDWVITFFRQTLFTPAGIDIYARTPSALTDPFKGQLIQALRNHPSNVVSSLANSMFDIPHDLT
ncbi:hypothetical protein PCANC_20503 [Puccinia coronata f. sp. avenae]|uniref:histidinol-phosphatase n=1 Tax=Puccinia coronata f. sp. avenae TaxID=200324 RepID=A0A2N5SCU2_9BASI|nr:hypothetical protein PCANC_20503 [Puccinia coronata f. sp. avenae]PLW39979.1 hypothetical protein PCASD_06820 [Puccinia coronata f. sp. avenae]